MEVQNKKLIYKPIDECPITGDTKYTILISLGIIPLVNNLSDTREGSLNATRYPLQVRRFEKSSLCSLSIAIDPKVLYETYTYKSSVSQPYLDHCEKMYDDILQYAPNPKRVLDIGGNDGALLSAFKKRNPDLTVLNVDASKNMVADSNQKGIPAQHMIWDSEASEKLNQKFDVITTTNAFQHSPDINGFAEGVANALTDDGIWCLEFPYWYNTVRTNQFDQIYHEHMYYYGIEPLVKLFSLYRMVIYDFDRVSIHGGSMRLYICKTTSKLFKDKYYGYDDHGYKKVQRAIVNELHAYYDVLNWGKQVEEHIEKSRKLLLDLRADGNNIVGFGAAAKGCIYLNAMKLDYNVIDYIVDDTELKQGKFMPGTGIEIVSRSVFEADMSGIDYLLILPHNFSEYIKKSIKAMGFSGKFIILLPNIRIEE